MTSVGTGDIREKVKTREITSVGVGDIEEKVSVGVGDIDQDTA